MPVRFPSFLLFALLVGTVASGPIETCSNQSSCVKFTVEKLSPAGTCAPGACEFKICMQLDLNDTQCFKSGTVSHTCEKPDDQCLNNGGFTKANSQEVKGISHNYEQCQIVPPGGVAEFLLKDGNAINAGGCGTASKKTEDNSLNAVCSTYGVQSCTGKGNVDKECVWRLTAPACDGMGGGDPHFKRWDGKRFSYHGECDLVMVHNHELDLHIRTKIQSFFSYIQAAALQLGEHVLEVQKDKVMLDGTVISDEQLPATISGYTLQAPRPSGNAKMYQLDLGPGNHIQFLVYRVFVSVQVTGLPDTFGDSVGLLGDYPTGAMLARDGVTRLDNATDAFGAEWQVRDHEPQLFTEFRDPSVPCRLPDVKFTESRHLRASAALKKAAEEACRHKSSEDFEFCVFDVLATGDVGMAGAW